MEHEKEIREADIQRNNERMGMFNRAYGFMGSIGSMINAGTSQYNINQNYNHRLDNSKLEYNKRVEDAHRQLNDAVESANRRFEDEISRFRV